MDAEGKRKQVSFEQLTALLEFLKENEELAKGLNRGRRRRGKFQSVKVWSLCAKQLNAIKGGAIKDGKGWSKYWCDWKYRVKRHALELKASKDSNRPLPEGIEPLSPMEENIMSIIGESAVDGVVIMNDPLCEGGLDEAIQNYTDTNEDSINQYFEAETMEPSAKSRKRQQSSDEDTAGPSSPSENKPTIDTSHKRDKGSSMGSRSCKRSRKQRLPNNTNVHNDRSSSPHESKPEVVIAKNENYIDSDGEGEDKASLFLSIEREKVCGIGNVVQSLESIHTEISRLVSVMADIKDCLYRDYRHMSVTKRK